MTQVLRELVRMNDQQIIQAYQEYLTEDGKGTKTVISYAGDVKGFLNWLGNKKVVFEGKLTRFYITSYKDDLIKNNYTINTINKKINSLHSFNLFLISKGFCHEQAVYPNKDKIKVAAGSEGEIDVFSDEEVERMLFYLENRHLVSQRDKTVILLLLYTGLRVSELVGLKLADIDLLTRNLKVVGKGGKYREVPLKLEAAEAIRVYLDVERRDHKQAESDYLLLTQRAGKMDKDTVNKFLRKHGKHLGLVLYPHKFRHTFCTRLLNKGVDLTTVAKLAGHASIQTTASFYINTSREDKQQAVDLL